MYKVKLIFLIVITLIILFSLALFLLNKHNEITRRNAIVTKAEMRVNTPKVDVPWTEYRDSDLGITFLHPITVNGDEMVFFKVNNVLFVTTKNSMAYKQRNEIDPRVYNTPKKIIERANELDMIWSRGGNDVGAWPISVVDLKGESLDKFTRVWFTHAGNKCTVHDLQSTIYANTQNVRIGIPIGGDDSFGNHDCFTNFGIAYKFSKTLNKVAVWDLGQDAKFEEDVCYLKYNYDCSIDEKIVSTFHFFENDKAENIDNSNIDDVLAGAYRNSVCKYEGNNIESARRRAKETLERINKNTSNYVAKNKGNMIDYYYISEDLENNHKYDIATRQLSEVTYYNKPIAQYFTSGEDNFYYVSTTGLRLEDGSELRKSVEAVLYKNFVCSIYVNSIKVDENGSEYINLRKNLETQILDL